MLLRTRASFWLRSAKDDDAKDDEWERAVGECVPQGSSTVGAINWQSADFYELPGFC